MVGPRVIALALALHGCSTAADPPAPAPTATPAPAVDAAPVSSPSIRVASYNLNVALVAEETASALEETDADIALLQEVGRGWEKVLRERFARYPHIAVQRYDRQRWGGLAVLSRYPFRDAELLPPKRGPFPAWRAVFDTPIGELEILNVHLYPPIRMSRKSGWIEAYREGQRIHVRELASFWPALGSGPALIAGDLNENARGDGVAWLKERGFSVAHTGGEPTWRWPTKLGEIKWQLDHILWRGPLEVAATRVIAAGRSDHLPIVAEFRRAGAGAVPKKGAGTKPAR